MIHNVFILLERLHTPIFSRGCKALHTCGADERVDFSRHGRVVLELHRTAEIAKLNWSVECQENIGTCQ